jgi:Flp pilus assembly protein protease CpaA
MILFLVVFCMLVALGFGIASGVSDFKSMTIPNIYAAGVLLAFIPAFAADAFSGQGMEFFASWKSHLIAMVAMFAVTFVLFSVKLIGAGDSKLITAFSLWVGLSGLAAFIFYMAVIGALLGIATKVMNKKTLMENPKEGSWIAKSQAGGSGVPYGIAIVCGAVIAFWQLDFFTPEKLALLAGMHEFTENQPIELE